MARIASAEGATLDTETARALGNVPQERKCLRCKTLFCSEGFGERICRRCKGLNAWRNAVDVSPGSSRRR
jgi:phage FluMu protein Com